MLTIRLSRVGKKKQAEYRLIINEKTKDPWGDVLEYLGYYNPRSNPAKVDLKVERIKYWLAQGAQMSDTVRNLFIVQKIITGDKVKPHGLQIRKKNVAKEETEKKEEKPESKVENTEKTSKEKDATSAEKQEESKPATEK